MKIVSGTKRSILAVSFLLNMFVFNAVVALPPEEKSSLRANNNNNNNNNNNEEYHQNSEKDSSGNNRNDDINRIRRFLKAQGGGGGGNWEDESVPSPSVNAQEIRELTFTTTITTTAAAAGAELIVPEAVTCGTNVGEVKFHAYSSTTEEAMGFEIIQRYPNGGFDDIWNSPNQVKLKTQYGLQGGEFYGYIYRDVDWDCQCVIFMFYDASDNKGFMGKDDYAAVLFKGERAFITGGKDVVCSSKSINFAYCGKIEDTGITVNSEKATFTFDTLGVWAASRGCSQ